MLRSNLFLPFNFTNPNIIFSIIIILEPILLKYSHKYRYNLCAHIYFWDVYTEVDYHTILKIKKTIYIKFTSDLTLNLLIAKKSPSVEGQIKAHY